MILILLLCVVIVVLEKNFMLHLQMNVGILWNCKIKIFSDFEKHTNSRKNKNL